MLSVAAIATTLCFYEPAVFAICAQKFEHSPHCPLIGNVLMRLEKTQLVGMLGRTTT
jgi:hypothetical protein